MGDSFIPIVAVVIVLGIVFGYLGQWIALQKGRAAGEGFLLGLLFGPLGVIIEAVLPEIPKR